MFKKLNRNQPIQTAATKTYRHLQKATKNKSINLKFKNNNKCASYFLNKEITLSKTDHWKVFQSISHTLKAKMKDLKNNNKRHKQRNQKSWYRAHRRRTISTNIIIAHRTNQDKPPYSHNRWRHPLHNPKTPLQTQSMKFIMIWSHHHPSNLKLLIKECHRNTRRAVWRRRRIEVRIKTMSLPTSIWSTKAILHLICCMIGRSSSQKIL